MMTDWYEWIRSVAAERIDCIERHLDALPADHPLYAEASRKLNDAMIRKEAVDTERDDLWMSYSTALALEMYLSGARDGGRVYHAFITGELPVDSAIITATNGGTDDERKD